MDNRTSEIPIAAPDLKVDMGYDSDLTDLSDISPPPAKKPEPQQLTKKKAKKAKPPAKRKQGTRPFRSHEFPKNLLPHKPAHHFDSVYRRRSQVADHLRKVFETATRIQVDFDITVAYFIQHTHGLNLGDIPNSVEKVLADFSILEPLTGRQENLHYCTNYIKQTLDYHTAHPGSPKPFALRYPNIIALNNLAIERSRSPIVVGKEGAVILLDLANRVVAVGVPPKESPFATTTSAKERGRLALVGAATVTNIGVFHGPVTKSMLDGCTIKPFDVCKDATSRLNGADSIQVQWPGTLTGFLPYQAVGYGRISSLAAGMSDTNFGLGKARQGHPDSNWQDDNVGEFNLPTLIQMGEEHAYKRETNARVESELLWYNEQARLLIKAIQPASYAAAMQALRVIVKKASPGASRTLAALVNPLGIGRHTMFGMQVDHHRDGTNAPFFASANFFGKHYGGGELILNYLGYAICGDPGYSVHAAFDILMHGVGRITRLPNKHDAPPQRICMALYSHADVFAGAARYSGMNQTPKVFSDRKLWIPFYAANFNLAEVIASFKAEEKRLDKKSQVELKKKDAAAAAGIDEL